MSRIRERIEPTLGNPAERVAGRSAPRGPKLEGVERPQKKSATEAPSRPGVVDSFMLGVADAGKAVTGFLFNRHTIGTAVVTGLCAWGGSAYGGPAYAALFAGAGAAMSVMAAIDVPGKIGDAVRGTAGFIGRLAGGKRSSGEAPAKKPDAAEPAGEKVIRRGRASDAEAGPRISSPKRTTAKPATRKATTTSAKSAPEGAQAPAKRTRTTAKPAAEVSEAPALVARRLDAAEIERPSVRSR